jgi:sensor c-di-GMP phosphodiesterase-like protein
MQDHRQDDQTGRTIIVAMAALGIVAGFALGTLLAIPLAELHLNKYLSRVATQEAASAREARDLLAGLQHSSLSACSDAELAHFRDLVFRSRYLKDVGRIHNGAIDCSATAGRPLQAIGQFNPAATRSDGTIAYSNLVPVKDDDLRRAGLQLGTAFVVYGASLPDDEGPLSVHAALIPANEGSSDESAGATTDNVIRRGDTLVGTHCSSAVMTCVAASVSVKAARQGELGTAVGTAGLGCIAGTLVGFLLSAFRRRHLSMDHQLRQSIEKNELQVVYQPIVNLVDGKVIGAEALARWKDRNGKPVSPDLFIKIAEQNGFVGSLTSLVFRRALSEFREVLTKIPDFRLDINVTAADLADPAFLPMLDAAVDQNKVSPNSVVIEVTESSTANQEVAMEAIRLLRRRGHSIYIDDFGTGYSSLSYLLYLQIDRIKIDKSFTRAIGTNAPTLAIIPQIMNMARSLNLGVVVEGVETEQQALYFTVNDQTVHGQGFLYSEPLPLNQFMELMAPKLARASAETEGERQFARAGLRASIA